LQKLFTVENGGWTEIALLTFGMAALGVYLLFGLYIEGWMAAGISRAVVAVIGSTLCFSKFWSIFNSGGMFIAFFFVACVD
tara:strand:+ start:569 stop:811 length:243 start_codon:yes stop_codon:yes gene_type:complete